MKKLTIYISGGMTGYKDFNYPKFNRVAEELRAKGFDVINPAADVEPVQLGGKSLSIAELLDKQKTGEIPQSEGWKLFLRGDIITMMAKCNAIYLLKNWKKSKGARFEHSCAKRMGFAEFNEGDL